MLLVLVSALYLLKLNNAMNCFAHLKIKRNLTSAFESQQLDKEQQVLSIKKITNCIYPQTVFLSF